MFDFRKFINIHYWLANASSASFKSYLPWLIGCLVLLIAYFFISLLVSRVDHPLKRKSVSQLSYVLLAISLVGLVIIFFRYEIIPIFSNNLVILIALFGLIVWLCYITIYYALHNKQITNQYLRAKIKAKYLSKTRR